MPSGGKELIQNTAERAISTDINRLQAFANADRAEMYRWMFDVLQQVDDLGIFVDVQTTTLTTPITGEIVGGLLVRPQLGSSGNPLGIIIDPGVAFVVIPTTVDNDPDASVYKLVRDPGIETLGVLNMTANASGSLRLDVIECQYAFNASVEVDNRDIFNPSTGLFAATTVNKAQSAGFTYRVRAGTPGAGFPGAASGWLPLAVASVPAGTTTNDTIVFYDVRPLLADRGVPPFNVPRAAPQMTRNGVHIDNNGGSSAFLAGAVETSGYADLTVPTYFPGRLGGVFGISIASGPDLTQAQYQSGTLSNGLAYVYLLAPFGLPRWVRYSPASSSTRVPLGQRGIVVISNTGPAGPVTASGPSSPLPLPTSLFGTASTSAGFCIATTIVSSGTIENMSCDGRFDVVVGNTSGYSTGAGSIASNSATFTMTPNGTQAALGYPASAKALRVMVNLEITIASSATAIIAGSVQGTNTGGSETYFNMTPFIASQVNASGGSFTWASTYILEIPVPIGVGASPWKLQFVTALTGGTLSVAAATIVGVALN